MTNDEILLRLTEIFRDVLDNDTIILSPATTSSDIPEWDSMAKVTLAVEIEHRLKVKFKSAEMEELDSVLSLVKLIQSRLPVPAA